MNQPTPRADEGAQRLTTSAWLPASPLGIARTIAIVIAVLVILLDTVSIPTAYQLLQTPCSPCDPNGIQMTVLQATSITDAGWSLAAVALYNLGIITFTEAVYIGVGLVLLFRRSDDRMALFTSVTLTTFGGAAFTGTMHALSGISPLLWFLTFSLNIIGQSSFMIFLFVFPSGSFVPRWTVIPTVMWTLSWALLIVPIPAIARLTNMLTDGPLFLVLILIMIAAQVYRYRRVSTPTQRQQTKWVVFGIGSGLAGFALTLILGNIVLPPSIANAVVPTLLADTTVYLCFLLIPLAIAVAILRSRLYDIDILINRTLVYGSLTAILAALYFGLVIGAQTLTRSLTSDHAAQQPIVIVLSTLLIAALVQPLRRRLQGVIDRRFYRGRYDAARTVAAFSASLRQEVELNTLSAHLLGVVEETMRPSHVSLWLTKPGRQRSGAEESR